MLKVLVYENDLSLLMKVKALLSSISSIDEAKIVNDETSCLKELKKEHYDILILGICTKPFKDSLLKSRPDIINQPILSLVPASDLAEFTKVVAIDILVTKFSLVQFLAALSDLIPPDILLAIKPLIEEFIPVKMSVFRKLKNTPCDIHIKLSKDKYVKIINEAEEIHNSFLDRYQNKNINELYIKKLDFYRCSDQLFENILPDAKSFESKTDYFSQSQQVIKDVILEIGINENVIKLADELVESALLEYKDPVLLTLLNKFKYSEDRYLYDHSVFTSILAVAICENFEWRNRQLMQKVVFASFFHDFGFTNSKLAFLENNITGNKELTKDQKNEILGHPQKMVDLLSKNKSISSEVLSMIAKHHEAQGENSYPLGLTSANLSILECVFIVAHQFSNELYKIAFRPDKIPKAIENVVSFCGTGNLKQVRAAFLTVVSKRVWDQ